jgi:hypothetical protein
MRGVKPVSLEGASGSLREFAVQALVETILALHVPSRGDPPHHFKCSLVVVSPRLWYAAINCVTLDPN